MIDLQDWAAIQRDMVPHTGTLTALARDAKVIIEFGVRGGVSTWAFLDGLSPDGQLWSVDIDQNKAPRRVRSDPRWRFIIGDDNHPHIRALLPQSADLVFIDTSHEYEHTLAELHFAATRNPRLIVCHDAKWPGVEKAVKEFCRFAGWHVRRFYEAHDEMGDFSLVVLAPRGR